MLRKKFCNNFFIFSIKFKYYDDLRLIELKNIKKKSEKWLTLRENPKISRRLRTRS